MNLDKLQLPSQENLAIWYAKPYELRFSHDSPPRSPKHSLLQNQEFHLFVCLKKVAFSSWYYAKNGLYSTKVCCFITIHFLECVNTGEARNSDIFLFIEMNTKY